MAAVRISITSWRGIIPSITTTPWRVRRSSAINSFTSCASSAVSGAPTHSTSWTSSGNRSAARSRWGTPFWRVMRPTNATEGLSGSIPYFSSAAVPVCGVQTCVSMPLWTVCTFAGSTSG